MIRYDRGLLFAGHPLHPALAHFPMGLLPASLAAEALAVFGAAGPWWEMGYWALAAGLAAGVVAAAAGLMDFVGLDDDHPARGTAIRHLTTTGISLALFLGTLLVWGAPGAPAPARLPWVLILSAAGVLALSIGGWFGGQLVFRFGVGQRPEERPVSGVTR